MTTNTTSITNLDARVTTNTTNISALTGRVSTLEGDVGTLRTQTEANTTRIASIDNRVTTNTSNIASVTTRVTTAETRLNNHDQRITALEGIDRNTEQRFNNVDARINSVDRKADKALDGVAVALAVSDPVLLAGDTFGIRMNWGEFQGKHAIGLSALGVLDRNFLGTNTSLAIAGGVGVSTYDGAVGSRLGLQLTWK